MSVKQKIEHFRCSCGHNEHQFEFTSYDWEDGPDANMQAFLANKVWYRRLLIAMKYVFGHKSVYGHFDEVCLNIEDVTRLRKWCEEFEALSEKYATR
jgi:hypothetical protein